MRVCTVVLVAAIAIGAQADPISEIARGESWASPYWGYSSAKIVCDGSAWYTAGLWGLDPAAAHGVLYRNDGSSWKEGARLEGIYQPAILALDPRGRLIVAYNRSGKALLLKRAAKPGDISSLEDLPLPPGEPEGYYLGLAIRDSMLYLAWIHGISYTMYLARLDLASLRWTPPVVVQEGQVETKPKTAWTYPILYPDAKGLHLVASNCPDGGDGNTYNMVWHLYYPDGASDASVCELVAESPVGYNAYASDMVVLSDGTVHVAYMYNVRKYGDPLPEGSAAPGTYHAWRHPANGDWRSAFLGPVTIAAFYEGDGRLGVVTTDAGAFLRRDWQADTHDWSPPRPVCAPADTPVAPGFFDVIARTSGSRMDRGFALVADGSLDSDPKTRVLWSLLPPP